MVLLVDSAVRAKLIHTLSHRLSRLFKGETAYYLKKPNLLLQTESKSYQ
ncbi:hypothetical protein DFP80_103141 [Marinomonas rhizomae]|uniref:Uncharacterized protein n=1 Tax=Marinomonas rhizomae TaxID=491948 RepID=A0A366JCE7_9GAMM|nr:hypothetical protein DFP80_103141 [Marinomonas rhizomae]